MSDTIKDFVEVEEISSPMSQSEDDSFLARSKKKGSSKHAAIEKNGSVIDPNEQVLAGAQFLVDNNIGV
jgi:hypothetical protein